MLKWDQVGERLYETGTDRGVLFVTDADGKYGEGVAWNGLTGVSNSPDGAETTPQYADNQIYINLVSAENYKGTINALMSPPEFDVCDGTVSPVEGVGITQQTRRTFGFAYRTLIGNDVSGTDKGYKIHLVYGAIASPSSREYSTTNDSPEALGLSWDFSTTPVEVTGMKSTAYIVIDSTLADPAALKALEDMLYGDGEDNATATLPTPDELIELMKSKSTTTTTTTTGE